MSVVGCGLWRWDMDTLAKGDRFLSLMGAGDVSLGGKRRGALFWAFYTVLDWSCRGRLGLLLRRLTDDGKSVRPVSFHFPASDLPLLSVRPSIK